MLFLFFKLKVGVPQHCNRGSNCHPWSLHRHCRLCCDHHFQFTVAEYTEKCNILRSM